MERAKDITTVIFDMDGVLLDTETLYLHFWTKIGNEMGIGDISEVIKLCTGTNTKGTERIVKEHLGNDFPFDYYRREVSTRFHAHVEKNGIPVKKGAAELLAYLAEEGYKIGLASSTAYDIVEAELKQAGLFTYFQKVVGGDMVENGKPAPDIYLMTCKAMQADPKMVYVIEDSYNGIRSAHAAGMIPIMVPDMLPPSEEIRTLCFRIEESLLTVKDFLQQK